MRKIVHIIKIFLTFYLITFITLESILNKISIKYISKIF